MRYTVTKKRFEHIDIGSMNHRITIETRTILPPSGDSVDYTLQFSVVNPVTDIKVWAMIENVSGKGLVIFDGENIERQITHTFCIRYLPSVTFEKWIKQYNQYSGVTSRYRIYRVEDLGEEHRFYRLYTGITGDITLDASAA
jgi:head-tail adaptor